MEALLNLLYFTTALALFNNCDFNIQLELDRNYFLYPKYKYPGQSCRWYVSSPADTKISLKCKNLGIDESKDCNVNRLEVSRSGSFSMHDSTKYCGNGSFRVHSQKNIMNVVFRTSRNATRFSFLCELEIYYDIETRILAGWTPSCSCNTCSKSWEVLKKRKIIGADEFPYLAGLVPKGSDDNLFCGATIISPRFSLTTGHCVRSRHPKNVGLLIRIPDFSAGYNSCIHDIDKFVIHSHYIPFTQNNDIALIGLINPLVFSGRLFPLCLPFDRKKKSFEMMKVEAIGWKTKTKKGQDIKVALTKFVLVSNENICNNYCNSNTTGKQLCIEPLKDDLCRIPSGNPLLWKDSESRLYVIGISSFSEYCLSDVPSVYMKITEYMSWIKKEIGTEELCQQ